MQLSESVRYVEVDEGADGQRIDNYLLKILKGVPKSKIYRIIRSGEVRVNKGRVKPEYRLQAGDMLRLPPLTTTQKEGRPTLGDRAARVILDNVLYEDEGLLVVNKPSGMAVHGGSGVSAGLIETLRAARPELKQLELVHRLDRETSGCLIVAKKASVLRELHAALRGDGVKKSYQALVVGKWPRGKRLVNAPLLKNQGREGERFVRVTQEGKDSQTEFDVIGRHGAFTLVEARPLTGRTHQIRVHAQFAGHPLAGDDKYGEFLVNRQLRERGLKRLFLHAWRLRFVSPSTRKVVEVVAPLPEELQAVLSCLESVG